MNKDEVYISINLNGYEQNELTHKNCDLTIYNGVKSHK